MQIDIKAANEDLTLSYRGSVAGNDIIMHEGVAEVTTSGISFEQKCATCTCDGIQYHRCNEQWTKTERTSALDQLSQWLELVQVGLGNYKQSAVRVSDLLEDSENSTQTVYGIHLSSVPFDICAWCNSYFDPAFGAAPTSCTSADVSLYFDCTTSELAIVIISAQTKAEAVAGTVILSDEPAAADSQFDPNQIQVKALDEDTLAEQWSILNPAEKMAQTNSPIPEKSILEEMKRSYIDQANTVCYIDGAYISLPCTAQQLVQNGFEYQTTTLDPGMTKFISFRKNGDIINVLIANETETALEAAQCTIVGIYLFPDNLTQTPIALPGGVTVNMTDEQIQQTWKVENEELSLYAVREPDAEYAHTCFGSVYRSSGKIYAIGIELT